VTRKDPRHAVSRPAWLVRACGPALLVLACGAVLFLTRANTSALSEPDEARYAEVSREMLASGDYVTPRFDHIRYLAKPPLLFWMTAGSFALLRPSEFAARLPCKLTAIASLLGCYLLGKAMFGRRAGVLSAVVLGSSVFYCVQGQLLRFDTPLALAIVAAFLLFWRAQEAPSPGHRALYCFFLYVALGVVALLKGPALVAVALLCIGAYYATVRLLRLPGGPSQPIPVGRSVRWIGLQVLLALVAFGSVAVPWYAAAEHANPGFIRYFLLSENLSRAFSEYAHPKPWWFFLLWTPVLVLPWTVLLPHAFAAGWREVRRKGSEARAWAFCAAWFAVCLVGFSASRAKLQVYMLPALPALALMIGKVAADISSVPKERALAAGGKVAVGLFAALTLLLAGGVIWYAHWRLNPGGSRLPSPLEVVLFALCVGALVAAGVWLGLRRRLGAASWACAAAIAAMTLVNGLVGAVSNAQSPKPLAWQAALAAQRAYEATGKRGRIVVYAKFRDMRGTVFYASAAPCPLTIVDTMPSEWRFDPDEARRSGLWFDKQRIYDFLPSDGETWYITERQPYDELVAQTGDRFVVLGTHGQKLLFKSRALY
jgi:4-amino-4-deoxy-L-arabinose transferase-like glycosyltransferase